MAPWLQYTSWFYPVELIISIVILGIISLGIGSYLRLGAGSYVSAVDRERLQSEARFVIERLTREVRHAAPNSVSVEDGAAFSFYPVELAAFYFDQPSATASQIELLPRPGRARIVDRHRRWWQSADCQSRHCGRLCFSPPVRRRSQANGRQCGGVGGSGHLELHQPYCYPVLRPSGCTFTASRSLSALDGTSLLTRKAGGKRPWCSAISSAALRRRWPVPA